MCEVICQFMLEMNPDVKGSGLNKSIKDFIDHDSEAILSSQIVIACELTNTYAAKLSAICEQRNIPMILLRQYGMIGYIRLFKKESCIIEPKKAQVRIKDLRLYNPWQELLDYAKSFDIESLPEAEHTHVPLAVILIQALDKWK